MESQQHSTHGTQRNGRGAQPGQAAHPRALSLVVLDGTLIVKWINGRNGSFAVGDLHTGAGVFQVKDALLEQFDAGEYTGRFWISQIYAKSYEYRGRITIETRANLADLQIDTEGAAPDDSGLAGEPDPAEETPRPPVRALEQSAAPLEKAAKPAPDQQTTHEGGYSDEAPPSTDDEADLALFGQELFEQVHGGGAVKLDATIGDRMVFRQQRERLKAMGYTFDVRQQTWSARH